MKTDQIVDSKLTTIVDLNGKKSKILLIKNETEIEAFKEQLRLATMAHNETTEFIVNIKHKDGVRDFLLFKMPKNSSIEEIKKEAISIIKEYSEKTVFSCYIPKKTILILECNVKNGIKIKTKWR